MTDSETPRTLDEAIAEFFQAVEAGGNPDPKSWLQRYPELARDLDAFFKDKACFERMAATMQGPKAAPPAPRERVRYFGDYELLDEIAQGGMGVVYTARQISLNRTVALKMILAGRLAGSEQVKRFRAEAEAAASLDHPNIVPIYEIGEHEGQHYFSMRFVEGSSLAREVGRLRTDPRGAVTLMAVVARAIHYAHQRGILHRDLKPANILLDAGGAPQVTDFGLAKLIDGDAALTESGAIMGTPSYMSPEQAQGLVRELTTATDVYSLGAILYELISGRPPFQGRTPVETIRQLLDREPPPPGGDRDLATIAMKCLEKDPAKRYGSAEALADDLERWLRHEPIVARPSASWERAVKWARRRPAAAALAAVCVVATVALIAGGAVFLRREQGLRREAQDHLRRARAIGLAAAADAAASEGRSATALLLAREAVRTADHPITAQRLRDALQVAAMTRVEFPAISTPVGAATYSPDGTLVLAYGGTWYNEKGTDCALFDRTGRVVASFGGHTRNIRHAEFSRDGARIVTASDDGSARLLDLSGRQLALLRPAPRARLSPDGSRVVTHGTSLGEATARLWDAAGKELALLPASPEGWVHDAAFSEDGEFILLLHADPMITICDANGRMVNRWNVPGNPRSINETNGLHAVFLPGGERILTTSHLGIIRIWDLAGRPLAVFRPGGGEVTSIALSPDGRSILVASRGNRVELLDLEGRRLAGFWGHTREVGQATFSPDGTRVLTVANVSPRETWVWDVRGHKLLELPPAEFAVFSPEGNRILACRGGELHELELGRTAAALVDASRDGVAYAGFENEGILVARDSGRVSVIDQHGKKDQRVAEQVYPGILAALCVDTPLWLAASEGGPVLVGKNLSDDLFMLRGHTKGVRAAEISPDGGRLFTGGEDGSVRIWDLKGRPQGVLQDGGGVVTQLVCSPRGDALLVLTEAGGTLLWDLKAATGLALEGHTDRIVCAAFSGAGDRIVTGSADGTARLWDLQGRSTMDFGGGNPLSAVSFSPDGSAIATATHAGSVLLWGADGRVRSTLGSCAYGARDVRFSPDGAHVAVLSHDGQVQLHAVAGGPVRTLRGEEAAVEIVRFTPGGKELVGACRNGSLLRWDGKGEPSKLGFLTDFDPVLITGSRDGKTLFVAEQGMPNSRAIFSLETGGGPRNYGPVWYPATVNMFHQPSIALAVTHLGVARFWDAEGRQRLTLGGDGVTIHSVDMSPDGSRILAGCADGRARIFDATGKEHITFASPGEWVSARFYRGGTRILTEPWGRKEVKTWTDDGTPVGGFDEPAGLREVSESPAGDVFLTLTWGGNAVHLRDETGRSLVELKHQDGVMIHTARFSPDGTRVVTGDDRGKVRLWSRGGKLIREFSAHGGSVSCAAFSDDGERIVTGGSDGTVLLRDGQGDRIASLRRHGAHQIENLRFSPDRRRLLVVADDKVWVEFLETADLLRLADERLWRDFDAEERVSYADLLP